MEEIIQNILIVVSTVSAVYFLYKKPKAQLKQKPWEHFFLTFFLTFAFINLLCILFPQKAVYDQAHIKTFTYFLMALFFTLQSIKIYKLNQAQLPIK